MGWRLNPALTAFRAAVDARYPKRDTESDGTIGDEAHKASVSDHNADPDGSVDAWDMDVELNGRGKRYTEDVEHLKRVFQAHEASGYWIHNDQIADRDNGWKRVPYKPKNRKRNKHLRHVHWNTRRSMERSKAPWHVGDDQDLTVDEARMLRDAHFVLARAVRNPAGQGRVPLHVWAGWMTGAVKAVLDAAGRSDEAAKAQLEGDLDALRARIEQATDEVVEAIRDTDDPEEIARRLHDVLGDQAPAVGALLQG
jgi:hypothetical protein